MWTMDYFKEERGTLQTNRLEGPHPGCTSGPSVGLRLAAEVYARSRGPLGWFCDKKSPKEASTWFSGTAWRMERAACAGCVLPDSLSPCQCAAFRPLEGWRPCSLLFFPVFWELLLCCLKYQHWAMRALDEAEDKCEFPEIPSRILDHTSILSCYVLRYWGCVWADVLK